ncbi:Replication protein [Erwinia sp. OLTSP20]|uniref:Replication protein n=2 Tax=Erwinia TaxID=551 RepID=UPI000C191BB1|nr:Replication protein [Erwinia sp. OLSSP12]PIJ50048.1 Replication protein [Erwinia sp. OAMSP11]PIJ80029.1 Replication protein [Erwinia sp. OLCASP19]PIJ82173.1 Replication protein [Erwinia sp. OLMTSP26]PIJ86409.1 Replication protein [Erwinia sp. OLMDSP33]PIJ89770.1 Replication protein [Erwinia sp. OLFS4]PIJ92704.1 Replication protein [Erwinia sp. OLTSP20]
MADAVIPLQQSDTPSVYRPSRRGESNRLRKGLPKTHRNHQPVFNGKIPRGMAAKVVACFRGHDWRRNTDLIALRRQGYTPYTRMFDPSFRPKPMRITPRSESREALTALSLVLAANCDYSPDSEYMFEVMMPVEELARRMGVLHVYESGRKAYDILLNALRVLEQLDYVVVHRDKDSDTGQNKPMRIFLTETCFTSRGMTVENVRAWLHKYRQWAVASGVAESMRQKYERHQLKMARLGISIDSHHALKNRLKKIKRWVVSPELRAEKERVQEDLGAVLDEQARKLRQLRAGKSDNRYESAWRRWVSGGGCTYAAQLRMENVVKAEHPLLHSTDPEQYYRLLLESAGITL